MVFFSRNELLLFINHLNLWYFFLEQRKQDTDEKKISANHIYGNRLVSK